jgi:hypothetical protein
MKAAQQRRTTKRASRAKTLQPFNTSTWLRQRHKLPMEFSIGYFQPGYAWRRAAVGPRYATGIEKQNATMSFVARDVRVPVQENVDIIRRPIWRNVLQPEFQPASDKIDNQWPLEIAVAISAHDNHVRPECSHLVKDPFRAHITKVPNFIRIPGHFLHAPRDTIMRVSENKNPRYRCRILFHFIQRKFGCSAHKNKAVTLMKA